MKYIKIIVPTPKIVRLFSFAERNAKLSEFGKFKHGAILARSGTILNASHNKNNTCSFGGRFRCKNKGRATLHAELGAILNMSKESTEGSDVYVVRINGDGSLRNSKPCPMCEEALRFCGIKRIFYSTGAGYFEVMKL